MKTSCATLAAIIFLCGCMTAFARIGETEAQIESRYGKSFATVRLSKIYFYGEFFVVVSFANGKSGREIYVKRDSTALNETEIRSLLNANSNGTKWHGPNRKGLEDSYAVANGNQKFFAIHDTLMNKLMVCDFEALKHIDQVDQVLDAKNMQGF
jgi:hypothetical protein